jgi:ketosteroid isomerase-like protein
MSTHQNVRMLRHTYDAFNRGDIQPLLDQVSDDIDWIDSTLGPLAGSYRGKAEVQQFFAKMMDIYNGRLKVELVDILANDGHGIVLTRESGRVNGEHVAWTSVHVWSFRGGLASRFVSYGSGEYQRYWVSRT